MHLLTFKETEAMLRGIDSRAYRDAERDFLRFHLIDFVSAVASKIGARAVPFYSDIARLAANLCTKELTLLST
jgi:hypothetical protein